MQDADGCDALVFDAEMDDVSLHDSASVTSPDETAVLCLIWSIGEHRAGALDHLQITLGLFQPPLPHGVVEYPVQIFSSSLLFGLTRESAG